VTEEREDPSKDMILVVDLEGIGGAVDSVPAVIVKGWY